MLYSPVDHGGQPLPQWANGADPEARLGTRRLRAVDPNLTVAYVAQAPRESGIPPRSYVIFSPSRQYRVLMPICVCQGDDGIPYRRGEVPWELILGMVRRYYQDAERGIYAPQKVAEAEAKREAAEEQAAGERLKAVLEYGAKAIGAELRGGSRWSAEDVDAGLGRALDGEKPAPKGLITSLPGKQAESKTDG